MELLKRLKTEIGNILTNIILNRIYERNSKIGTNIYKMIDRVIIDLPAVERHLEGVIQIFLQFNKEYLIFSLEAIPIYGIIIEMDEYMDARRNQRHLMLVDV
jgi:hypothetical protein